MLLLNAGILWISFYRQWGVLHMLGFVNTYILYATWAIDNYQAEKFWPAILFLNAYYLIYAVTPLAYSMAQKKNVGPGGFAILFPNTFLAFAFSWGMVQEKYFTEAVSIVTVLYALIFLVFAAVLQKRNMSGQPAFAVFVSKAAFFLFLTVPFLFSGHWVTLFWVAQAAVLLWLGERLRRDSLKTWGYILELFVSLKFFLYDYPEVFHISVAPLYNFMPTYGAMALERLATSAVIVGGSAWFARTSQGSGRRLFAWVTGFSLFFILNVETSAFFNQWAPTMTFAAISVLWGIFSAALMIIGLWKDTGLLRKFSIGLFFATLIKVFLIDMARVSTPARIISFIVTGMLLIGTSFLYHRFRVRIVATLGGLKNENL
jgi:uncharacterized membrane protein